jgi:DHA1 family bicyclomycin/chloramphenicol resistance-like MFS transporter
MGSRKDLLVPQRLGYYGIFFATIFFSLVTPMSLDMYAPALPMMTEYFSASETQVNMTLTGYFLIFVIGILLSGPMSDKYGRKPLLVVGAAVYTIGSAACALSPDINALIFSRFAQAAGAGIMGSVAFAVIKDCYESKSRARVFAVGQSAFTLGPILAPVIGGIVLSFASWRALFWILTGIGGICVILTLLFEESLTPAERSQKGMLQTVGGIGHGFTIKGFIPLLLVATLSSATFMSFVLLAPYVFEQFYGFSIQAYGYFFAACVLFTSAGPFVYLRMCKRAFTPRKFTHLLVFALASASLLLIPLARTGAYVFFALCSLIAFCQMTFKAYINNVLISEIKSESKVGSASSLINFMGAGTGFLGMTVASLAIGLPIDRFTSIAVVVGILNVAAWLYFCKRGYKMHNLERPIEAQR